MARLIDSYHQTLLRVLGQIRDGESENIMRGAELIAKALLADKIVYVAGSGHSHMIAEEGFYRAGGIAALQGILEPQLMLHEGALASTAAERVPGLAAQVIARYAVQRGSVVIVVSNSGRNAYPIEMAQEAQKRGASAIAITSLAVARSMPSRHPSGKLLADIADVVIDNHVPLGDAAVDLQHSPHRMGPTSTIAGSFILNSMLAEAVDRASQAGGTVDIYNSANGPSRGETAEDVAGRWQSRIQGLQ